MTQVFDPKVYPELLTLPPGLRRLRLIALVVGVAGCAICLMQYANNPGDEGRSLFFRAYLCGYMFWLGASLGGMALVMIANLTNGEWGVVIRRLGEAFAATLPLMAIFFIPVLAGIKYLYPWAMPEIVATDSVLQHKIRYLNTGSYETRAAIYFAIWIILAVLLNIISSRQDRTGSPAAKMALLRVSAAGLILYFFTMTFASVDWIVSREARWYSTIIGIIVCIGQTLTAMALIAALLTSMLKRKPFSLFVHRDHLNDLGNLLLTLVILWAYTSLSQLLVTWMGNIKEEALWYTHRGMGPQANGWRLVGQSLIVFHFAVPFFLLLIRNNKRKAGVLLAIALGILVMRYVDVLWLIIPSSPREGAGAASWIDFVSPFAIGGIWMAVMLTLLGWRPLLPLREPASLEMVDHVQAHAPGVA